MDFSGYQTNFYEQKRVVAELNSRLTALEEQQEDLDLSAFEGKD